MGVRADPMSYKNPVFAAERAQGALWRGMVWQKERQIGVVHSADGFRHPDGI